MKAAREKGRILILGDQGVNRSATLTVIFNVPFFFIKKFYHGVNLCTFIRIHSRILEMLKIMSCYSYLITYIFCSDGSPDAR